MHTKIDQSANPTQYIAWYYSNKGPTAPPKGERVLPKAPFSSAQGVEAIQRASTLRGLVEQVMNLSDERFSRPKINPLLEKSGKLEITAFFSDGQGFLVPQTLYFRETENSFEWLQLDEILEHFPTRADLQRIEDIVAADMEDGFTQDDEFDVDLGSSDVEEFENYKEDEQEELEEASQLEVENSFVSVEAEPVPEIISESIIDARERVAASIVRRRGQPEFRKALIEAYDSTCAITGCNAVEALEAAHISPYRGPDTNRPSNGLLLRADLHTLFDLGLIAVDTKTMTVVIAESLLDTTYAEINGQSLRLPVREAFRPNLRALDKHRSESKVG